jgi:uncharacterized DUF497 family protein
MQGVLLAWNAEKNRMLKEQRGLAFEDVAAAIAEGQLIDDVPHPSEKFPHQRMLVVKMGGYTCLAPYVQDGETKFLKTLYKSRKSHRQYGKATENGKQT